MTSQVPFLTVMENNKENTGIQLPEYDVFRGLQLPLELFGFKGRSLVAASIVTAVTIVAFFVVSSFMGKLMTFLICVPIGGLGVLYVRILQAKGLHSKHRDKGVFIYHHLFGTF